MGAPFPPDFGSLTLLRVHEDFGPVLIVFCMIVADISSAPFSTFDEDEYKLYSSLFSELNKVHNDPIISTMTHFTAE